MDDKKMFYEKKGQVTGAVGAVISLVVGTGVAILILIFVGVLGGQAYNTAEPDILNISDATIRTHVTNSVTSGFSALEDTGGYLPLIILGIVIFIILTLILGFTSFGGNQGGGMAL